MSRSALAALCAVALLAACATLPSYAPQGAPFARGYGEQRIDQAHWRVEYVGDTRAPRDLVERYLLFRSAQLTLSSGYDWFETSDHETDTEIVVYAPPLPRPGAALSSPQHGDVDARGPRPAVRPARFERFVSHQTIAMGHGEPPTDAFDAAALQALLSPAVRHRQAGN